MLCVLEPLSDRNVILLRKLCMNESIDLVLNRPRSAGRQQAMSPKDTSSMHQNNIVVISTMKNIISTRGLCLFDCELYSQFWSREVSQPAFRAQLTQIILTKDAIVAMIPSRKMKSTPNFRSQGRCKPNIYEMLNVVQCRLTYFGLPMESESK